MHMLWTNPHSKFTICLRTWHCLAGWPPGSGWVLPHLHPTPAMPSCTKPAQSYPAEPIQQLCAHSLSKSPTISTENTDNLHQIVVVTSTARIWWSDTANRLLTSYKAVISGLCARASGSVTYTTHDHRVNMMNVSQWTTVCSNIRHTNTEHMPYKLDTEEWP